MCWARWPPFRERSVPFKFRQRDIRKIVLIVLVLAGGAKSYETSFQSTPIGQEVGGLVTHISDGDTIRLNAIKIRLWGVDAPEKGQKGFHEAGDFLSREILYKMVSCTVHAHDKYGRLVAQCSRDDDDADIGAMIIGAGRARDHARYSKGYYLPKEIQAKNKHLGLWQ